MSIYIVRLDSFIWPAEWKIILIVGVWTLDNSGYIVTWDWYNISICFHSCWDIHCSLWENNYMNNIAVLWIQNDLFQIPIRIRIQLWIFQVPDPDPALSYGSGSRQKFRIQAKVPDPCVSGSNPCYLTIFRNCKQNHLKFNQKEEIYQLLAIFYFILRYSPTYSTQSPEFTDKLHFYLSALSYIAGSMRIRIWIHNTAILSRLQYFSMLSFMQRHTVYCSLF